MKYIPYLRSKLSSNNKTKRLRLSDEEKRLKAEAEADFMDRIDTLFPALFTTFLWVVGNWFTGRTGYLLETSFFGYAIVLTFTVLTRD